MTVNRYTEAPGLLLCTSTTHPLSPSPGDRIYEVDTGKELTYQGPNNTWTLPWGVGWGTIAESKATAAQAGITTIVDITSITVTFTAAANRKYLVTMLIPLINQITAAGTVTPEIQTLASGAGTRLQAAQISLAAGGVSNIGLFTPIQTPAAGSTSYHGRIATSAGSLTISNAAAVVSIIRVEDIGPNGAPT